jgi:hypothetical protein
MRPTGTGKHPTDPGAADATAPTFPSNQPPRPDSGKNPFGIEPFQLPPPTETPTTTATAKYLKSDRGLLLMILSPQMGQRLRLYDRATPGSKIDNANTVTIRNRDDVILGPARQRRG